jgi:hypothetical protein
MELWYRCIPQEIQCFFLIIVMWIVYGQNGSLKQKELAPIGILQIELYQLKDIIEATNGSVG